MNFGSMCPGPLYAIQDFPTLISTFRVLMLKLWAIMLGLMFICGLKFILNESTNLFICTLHWLIVCKLGREKHSHLGRGNLSWRTAFIKLVSWVFCSFIKQGLGHCGQWPHKVVRLGMYNKSSWARRGKGAFPCSLHHFLLPDTCLEFFSWLLSMMK